MPLNLFLDSLVKPERDRPAPVGQIVIIPPAHPIHFPRRAGDEDLVGRLRVVERERPFFRSNLHLLREIQSEQARDARQNFFANGVSNQDIVANDEDVAGRALGDDPILNKDRLIGPRFDGRRLRQDVREQRDRLNPALLPAIVLYRDQRHARRRFRRRDLLERFRIEKERGPAVAWNGMVPRCDASRELEIDHPFADPRLFDVGVNRALQRRPIDRQ